MSGGKIIYIFAKDIHSKRKFEIKAKNIRPEKGLFFWVTLIQAVVSLLQNICLFTKYEISLFLLLQAEITGRP